MPPKKKAIYKFPERIPNGTILQDKAKKQWKLGSPIGKGGFGEIYAAQEAGANSNKWPYVIKIEPHANGPLFVEINFYVRHTKPADIEEYKKNKGLKTLGIPIYRGSGSLIYKDEKYRFLVMDKFSTDLYKLFTDNGKQFPADTVFKVALQLLDALEYIHQNEYVHADIKAANILLGATKETQNKQVYLVDFGMAARFTTDKEFKPDPKKAHNGTIEYVSRDAHKGVLTRRGDLEILSFNLLHWLGCTLPWDSKLSDPKQVQESKEEHMSSASKIIKACFGQKSHPKAMKDFISYVLSMKFNSKPDYKKIRSIFLSGVKEASGSVGSALKFVQESSTSKATSTRNKRVKSEDQNNDDNLEGPTKAKRERPKRGNNTEETEDSDMENGQVSFITLRRGNKRRSMSLESFDSITLNGNHNEEIKNVLKKKLQRGVRKHKKNDEPQQEPENTMAGYTDEMKLLAVKLKKSKEKPAGKAPARRNPKRAMPKVATENGSLSD